MKIVTLTRTGTVFDNCVIEKNDKEGTLSISFDRTDFMTKAYIKDNFGVKTNLYKILCNDDSTDEDAEEFIGYTRVKSIEFDVDGDDRCTVILRKPTTEEFMDDTYDGLNTLLGMTDNLEMITSGAYVDVNSNLLTMAITQLGGN